MNLHEIYSHERYWAFERERIDRINRLRVALQLTKSRRGIRAEIASTLCRLARRVGPEPEAAPSADASCPWVPGRTS